MADVDSPRAFGFWLLAARNSRALQLTIINWRAVGTVSARAFPHADCVWERSIACGEFGVAALACGGWRKEPDETPPATMTSDMARPS
jgi:hypothetical protein